MSRRINRNTLYRVSVCTHVHRSVSIGNPSDIAYGICQKSFERQISTYLCIVINFCYRMNLMSHCKIEDGFETSKRTSDEKIEKYVVKSLSNRVIWFQLENNFTCSCCLIIFYEKHESG